MHDVCGRMGKCKAEALQKTPLHVIGAGKCRGPHQSPVLTLPAWKLLFDMKLGSSKGKQLRMGDGGWQQPRSGLGTPALEVKGTGDRQSCIRAEQGLGFSLLNFEVPVLQAVSLTSSSFALSYEEHPYNAILQDMLCSLSYFDLCYLILIAMLFLGGKKVFLSFMWVGKHSFFVFFVFCFYFTTNDFGHIAKCSICWNSMRPINLAMLRNDYMIMEYVDNIFCCKCVSARPMDPVEVHYMYNRL